MRIALAQINTRVGDIEGNVAKIKSFAKKAQGLGADLAVFPELCIPGYPPWDLLERKDFIRQNLNALGELAESSGGTALLVGFADVNSSRTGKPLFNSAALLYQGKVLAKRSKSLLPTYDVFDEARHFEPAKENLPIPFKGVKLGVTICEDCWNDPSFWDKRLYHADPVQAQARQKAKIFLNLSASPFHQGKVGLRHKMLQSQIKKTKAPFLYCNLVGGNDELIFDGNSLILDGRGRLLAHGRAFEEDILFVDLENNLSSISYQESDPIDQVHKALVLGLKDYVQKCGFKSVLLGLSGGIDSAVVGALAAEALGPENVTGVSMPSVYSSEGSLLDAQALAKNLGIRHHNIPINRIYRSCLDSLKGAFRGTNEDVTEQNLQARIRGNLLMALSNKFGAMVLSTGNKSELSMGYCTLYGDMSGGLAVLGDVPKTTVYALAKYINKEKEVIPVSSITKPPSAELKPDQKDQDDLPPYEVLDKLLERYIEKGKDPEEIAQKEFSKDLVLSVIRRIERNEYKRRQAPPVLKITPKAFGVGRKMPIARAYH